jgi:hypothetical protein
MATMDSTGVLAGVSAVDPPGLLAEVAADGDEFPCLAQHFLGLLICQVNHGLVITLLAEIEGFSDVPVELGLDRAWLDERLRKGGNDALVRVTLDSFVE